MNTTATNDRDADNRHAMHMLVYADIRTERERQDAEWGGPEHDDTHDDRDWRDYRSKFELMVAQRATDARDELSAVRRANIAAELIRDYEQSLNAAQRRDLVKIAALAVAQIESLDRGMKPEPSK